MTVYVRTEEGQLAAYSPDSALPRKLRSLLKVIDGKTTVEVYINSLQAFGDVQGVLKSFDMAGLIRPLVQAAPYLPEPVPAPALEPEPASAAEPPSRWSSAKTMLGNKLSPQKFKPSQPSLTNNPTIHVYGESVMPNRDMLSAPTDPQALTRAVDLMSDFILINAPAQAMMVLKELEQLQNLEQLAVTLGGYEQVISHVGAPAQAHLLLIKSILRENM
jgi:hypothetical protein